jgi:putative transposase
MWPGSKKNLASTLTRVERCALVERQADAVTLTDQADLLSLSRRSLYYQPIPPAAEEVAIKHAIDRIYTDQPSYGSRRIAVMLKEDYQLVVNRKAVQRHMREMGIAGISPGPNLSRRNPKHRVYPYLLRDVTAAYPNHVWSIDITYIRLVAGWMYLVAVLDLYTRYVVSWALDDTLEQPFVLDAVRQALTIARPQIWNSDQGSHFTSPQYTQLLLDAGVHISMDGKGRALDNVFIERLWRTIKYEEVYLREYGTPREAHYWLSRYLAHYNEKRPHSSLDYRPPAALYSGHAGMGTAA